ncbi:DUF3467 domain-containing protein [bacterium]|nr:DUF3467 domain-containing protein [candidate division CSSED10-310 bacterium]
MNSKQSPGPVAKVSLKIDPSVENGIYANSFTIAHTENEFILDFSMALPGVKSLKVVSRIIIHPRLAKRIMIGLQDSVRNYESKFGTINLGSQKMVLPQPKVMN